jgi:hypothetical protein
LLLDEKVPTKKNIKSRRDKKPAAATTVSMDQVKKATKPETVKPDEATTKPADTETKEPEPVDVRRQGRHRHMQHQDKKQQKDKSFFRQIFRRKSGE